MSAAILRRARRASCFAVAALVGVMLPLGEGCGSCPDFVPAYRITEDLPDWVVGSGRVELTDTAIVITYETMDGAKWKVEYKRVKDPDWAR